MMSLVGGVIGAAASFYDAYQSKSLSEKEMRRQRRMWTHQMAAYEESQNRIWGAYNAEVQRVGEAQAAENLRIQAKQTSLEELFKPYQEVQLSALQKYREAAEAPETSPYARLRMEESEKAINKELARRGILFSGAASELREKSRRNIMAEETERSKTMLQNLMTGVTPVSAPYMPGAFYGGPGIPGGVGMPGIPGAGGSAQVGSATQAANALMGGLYGYQQAQGYQQQMQDLKYYGRQTGAPTGLYGGSMEQYAPAGW